MMVMMVMCTLVDDDNDWDIGELQSCEGME